MYKDVSSPGLQLSRAEPRSSECPHASSARSGRVAAVSPAFTRFAAVGSFEEAPGAPWTPRFIDIPADRDDVVLERQGASGAVHEVWSRTGARTSQPRLVAQGAHGSAYPDRYYFGGAAYSWNGAEAFLFGTNLNALGEQLACGVARDGNLETLIANSGAARNRAPEEADYTQVARVSTAGSVVRGLWRIKLDEPGVGAIDAAGQAVVVLPSGRFLVLLPEADGKGNAVLATDARADAGATDASIVPPFAMLLYGGGAAGALAARRSAGLSASRLDAVRVDGTRAWTLTVPFLATQPPIDGNDVIYLVGGGLAAVGMDGHLLWSSLSSVPIRAQAFGDGSLAVVRGNELQIVAHDGAITRSFRAPDELTTYPAIASDGSVWVATEKALYVAR